MDGKKWSYGGKPSNFGADQSFSWYALFVLCEAQRGAPMPRLIGARSKPIAARFTPMVASREPIIASSVPRQIVMGVATAVLGLFLLAYPLMAGRLPMGLLGWVLILAGVAQLVFAIYSQTLWSFALLALRSVLLGGAGGCLVYFHLEEMETLTALLLAMLLAGAGVEGGIALLLKPEEGRAWALCDAVTGFLMGALILAGWPASTLWAMGTLVGVSVMMAGACRVAIAFKLGRKVGVVKRQRVYPRAA